MERIGYCLLIFGLMAETYGLQCYDCNIYNFDGDSTYSADCLNPVSNSSSATCPVKSDSVNYCRTDFKISDGVVTTIKRGCQASDKNESTTYSECETNLQAASNPTDTTTCYFYCKTDKCNIKTTSFLKKCTNKCENGGACNYIIGKCQCTSVFSGANCATPKITNSRRRCVQCNSATDGECVSSTTASDCPGSEAYCSTATTSILQGDEVVQTLTTRGCSNALIAADTCSFTNIYTDSPISDSPPGYKEFTCFSTCDFDGCNTNTADGVINTNENVTLQCVQCSDPYGGGHCNSETARSTCPSGSTHCKSTVIYLISDRTDIFYSEAPPVYQLVSFVRECAKGAVGTSCVETKVKGVNLKKVTCTETCQEDGCNTGWPARPKCIKCNTPEHAEEYDECLENPPIESDCEKPYEAYCILRDAGIEKRKERIIQNMSSLVGVQGYPRLFQLGVQGYPRRISRGCSYYNIGNACVSKTIRYATIENCNRTCNTDGCNVGIGLEFSEKQDNGGVNISRQPVLVIAMSTVLGLTLLINF